MNARARAHHARYSSIALALLCACAVWLSACGGGETEVSSVEEIPPGIDNAREALRSSWTELAVERQRSAVDANTLEGYFHHERPGFGLTFRRHLRDFYASRDFRPVFTTADGLPNFRGRAVVEALTSAEEHALNERKYARPTLLHRIRLQGELLAAWRQLPVPRPDSDGWATLDELVAADELDGSGNRVAAVLDRVLPQRSDSLESSPLPELSAAWLDRLRIARAIAGNRAAVELQLADAWADWAYDMHDFNYVAVNPDAEDDEQRDIIRDQMRASLNEMAAATDMTGARAVVDDRIPPFVQYERLQGARRRYLEIVQAGGWQEVNPTSLSRGSHGAVVEELKARLAAEGFFEGEMNDRYDADLEEAVRNYQETHQMEVTGRTSREFWSSLNVPAEQRLAQIELTMQRWRESRIGESEYYFHVNIPDFHAELWRNGVMERRFRIVVGNTHQMCRNGRMQYVNATPIQSAEMSYVILNPYWNVPSRIMREELLPAAVENPNFFAENGYEYITLENGATLVRQMPGENNALGAVKFMFPNEHDTYMHDTPRRQFFNYPVRAFSHGCMRVQDPLGLLEHVLRNDNQWDPNQIERLRESGRESRLNLREPIPVHIEYFVVRVDEDERVHFNADIYRLDRARLDPEYVREEPCDLQSSNRAPEFRLANDGRILTRNEEGELVDAREAQQEEGVLPMDTLPGDVGESAGSAPVGLPGDFGP